MPDLRQHNILIDGKPHKVKLRALKVDKESPFLVEVNDKSYEVRLATELIYGTSISINVSGRPYRVELEKPSKTTPFSVRVNGKSYRVQYDTINKAYPRTLEPTLPKPFRTPIRKTISEKGVVTAALPGRVVSLKVKAGDSVKVGDALCVLEAMKMENEITAPVRGVVEEIMVSEGAIVNKGQSLVLIK